MYVNGKPVCPVVGTTIRDSLRLIPPPPVRKVGDHVMFSDLTPMDAFTWPYDATDRRHRMVRIRAALLGTALGGYRHLKTGAVYGMPSDMAVVYLGPEKADA